MVTFQAWDIRVDLGLFTLKQTPFPRDLPHPCRGHKRTRSVVREAPDPRRGPARACAPASSARRHLVHSGRLRRGIPGALPARLYLHGGVGAGIHPARARARHPRVVRGPRVTRGPLPGAHQQ